MAPATDKDETAQTMRFARFAAAAAFAAGLSLPAAAQDQQREPNLTPNDRLAISQVEDYLESITSLHAQFRQVSSNGGRASGEVWLDRPGKLRFEYDPPAQQMIVANGNLLLYWDQELEQTSYVPISETPLWFLLADEIDVSQADGYQVARVAREADTLRIQVVQEGNWLDEPGSVTLEFGTEPLTLRTWRIVDQQGVATEVSLHDVDTGVTPDPDLFDFAALDLPKDAPGPGR
jgi:outer membrane lipoprotein-sorting protein